MDQPTTSVGTTLERIKPRREEVEALLRGLLASLSAMRARRDVFVALIQKEFKLAPDMATQVYEALFLRSRWTTGHLSLELLTSCEKIEAEAERIDQFRWQTWWSIGCWRKIRRDNSESASDSV